MARITRALPCGEHRAKTRMAAISSQSSGYCSQACSSTDSTTTRSCVLASSVRPPTSSGIDTASSALRMPLHVKTFSTASFSSSSSSSSSSPPPTRVSISGQPTSSDPLDLIAFLASPFFFVGSLLLVTPQPRATCRAVRAASPVTMATWWLDSLRARITTGESARVLHVNAMKPPKLRSASTQLRLSSFLTSYPLGHRLYARASTRMPSSAMALYDASYHAGTLPVASSFRTASGEPLTRQYLPELTAPSPFACTSTTTLMR
mmetsp:Transcript_25973/g.60815  ORF Transcript_25973/g.60815 Transcript_25973/m.60815 type:complete len:263 (-) Transcript_25973:2661-3449(-)